MEACIMQAPFRSFQDKSKKKNAVVWLTLSLYIWRQIGPGAIIVITAKRAAEFADPV